MATRVRRGNGWADASKASRLGSTLNPDPIPGLPYTVPQYSHDRSSNADQICLDGRRGRFGKGLVIRMDFVISLNQFLCIHDWQYFPPKMTPESNPDGKIAGPRLGEANPTAAGLIDFGTLSGDVSTEIFK